MTDETRFVLVKPGDVLLIGNMGEITEELPEALHAFKEAVGVSYVAVFPGDISISTASSADVEHPSTDEPGVVRHGTDDLYPYGGSYDEGRDYHITCYCGVEFTGETDRSVEASLDEHVDRMSRGSEPATDDREAQAQQFADGGVVSGSQVWVSGLAGCVIEPPTPPVIQITGEAGVIVAIQPDGTVDLGPGASTDEAAQAFWDAVTRLAPDRLDCHGM